MLDPLKYSAAAHFCVGAILAALPIAPFLYLLDAVGRLNRFAIGLYLLPSIPAVWALIEIWIRDPSQVSPGYTGVEPSIFPKIWDVLQAVPTLLLFLQIASLIIALRERPAKAIMENPPSDAVHFVWVGLVPILIQPITLFVVVNGSIAGDEEFTFGAMIIGQTLQTIILTLFWVRQRNKCNP